MHIASAEKRRWGANRWAENHAPNHRPGRVEARRPDSCRVTIAIAWQLGTEELIAHMRALSTSHPIES